MQITINNKEYEIRDTRYETRLIDLLRNDLKLTGTKEGCGEGECGACSVTLNGRLVNSCLILVGQLSDGDGILTIEGVENVPLGKKLQKSFVKHGAVQCGFCIPGMVMAGFALLKKNKKPSRKEIVEGISGNLCRCTGYKKIIEAIESVK
ncbi:MAG: (2Fe-2S)-binding protein [Deltaproteobacteria bacterium CG11_big_fil_rev_8_21_14_0_20_49_13]|nr:MAG: (2Fe-2S)-binding protein [Deltaproteobacteria bacterium CG11_big_fil_rev_8_21_14_0_20_49_13]